MGLTVTTPAPTRVLTTVAQFKMEMSISGSSDDTLIDALIRRATDAVERYCNRVFARQAYTETGGAYGGPYFPTRQAPLVSLTSAAFNGDTLTDVSIQDGGEGLLYRRAGFDWTAQRLGLTHAGGLWLDDGLPLPLSEEPLWSFSYVAGFILPPQNLVGVSTVSASAVDNSFNDSAGGFPSLLKAGDIIETSGFSNSENNGRFAVTGTPTASKIVVAATLTTESAPASSTVLVSNLPGDVEQGALETVKSLWARRSVDSSIVERQAGVMRIRHSEQQTVLAGLPPLAVGYLHGWRRSIV